MSVIKKVSQGVEAINWMKSRKPLSEFKKLHPDLMKFFNIVSYHFRMGYPMKFKPASNFAGLEFYDTGTYAIVTLDPENERIISLFSTKWDRNPIDKIPYEMINWMNNHLTMGKYCLTAEIDYCNERQLQYSYLASLSYAGIDKSDVKSIDQPVINLYENIDEYKNKFDDIIFNHEKLFFTLSGEIQGRKVDKYLKNINNINNKLAKKGKYQSSLNNTIKSIISENGILKQSNNNFFVIDIPCGNLEVITTSFANSFDQIIIESKMKIQQNQEMLTDLLRSKLLQIVNAHLSSANISIDFVNSEIIIKSGIDVSGMKGKFNKSLYVHLLEDHIFSLNCLRAFDEFLNGKSFQECISTILEGTLNIDHDESLLRANDIIENLSSEYPVYIRS